MRDDLPHAMRETARRLEPDVVRLAAGGVSRGTRMRRVERAAQVLGSAVAVAVVFAGVVLVGSHRTAGVGGGAGGTNPPAASGPGNMSTEASPGTPNGNAGSNGNGSSDGSGNGPTPSATPANNPPSSSSVPQISQGDLIGTLKTLLGGAGVSGGSYVALGTDVEHGKPGTTGVSSKTIMIDAQLTAGKSVGYISIVISGLGPSVPPLGTPQAQKDGSVAYVAKKPGSSDGRHNDRTDLFVTLVRPGGSTLTAVETDAPNEKSAAPHGAVLLLSPDQVTSILDSPAWNAAIAATDALSMSAEGNGSVPSATKTGTSSPSGDPTSSPSGALETVLMPD